MGNGGFFHFEARIHSRRRVAISSRQSGGYDHPIWKNGEIMTRLGLKVNYNLERECLRDSSN